METAGGEDGMAGPQVGNPSSIPFVFLGLGLEILPNCNSSFLFYFLPNRKFVLSSFLPKLDPHLGEPGSDAIDSFIASFMHRSVGHSLLFSMNM
jgi:hypothetical protein